MERKWKRKADDLREQIEELPGKTVGIVGLGRIGDEIAKKTKSLGMRVLAIKRTSSPATPAHVDKLFPPQKLEELLAVSDFLVLSLPLTKETRGMIGESQLKNMKRTSYLINVSRGKIVREEKLVQALKECLN